MSQSECGTLQLMSIDRKNPRHCSVKLVDVQRIDKKDSTFLVYRPGDKAPTLTASGEPPRLVAGLLVAQNGDVYIAGCRARARFHRVPEQDLQFLMEIGCNGCIGGMVTVPTARDVMQLLVEPAVACTLPAVADNNGKKPRKATIAAGQDTPSVSERRPPLSSL